MEKKSDLLTKQDVECDTILFERKKKLWVYVNTEVLEGNQIKYIRNGYL